MDEQCFGRNIIIMMMMAVEKKTRSVIIMMHFLERVDSFHCNILLDNSSRQLYNRDKVNNEPNIN